MILTRTELVANIAGRCLLEHTAGNVELKPDWQESFGHKISALANREGEGPRWLVIGLKDDGSLVGHDISWLKKCEEILSQHINRCLDPIQSCRAVSSEVIQGKFVIILELANPGALVYWNQKAYKGAGTTTKEMEPREMMETTIRLPGLADRTAQPWHGEINRDLVASYATGLAARRSLDPFDITNAEEAAQEYLARLGVGGIEATRLLFGPATFRVVKYRGDEPVCNDRFAGLYRLLSWDFRQSLQPEDDKSAFPDGALKEALANAVAHAAYFESDGDIIVEVWPDKISISNLSVPNSGAFANKWFSTSHHTQNKAMMEALRLAGLVDELGRGKRLIFVESIKNGKQPPQVSLETAGRLSRWRLNLFGAASNERQLRLLKQLREKYGDERKALLALALILWKDLPVAQIKEHVDADSAPLFLDVVGEISGPVLYYKEADRLILRRWVRILIEEGKESKTFSPAEETHLYNFAKEIAEKYYAGEITSKKIRQLGDLGETSSAKSMCSGLVKKWQLEGKLKMIKRGIFQFPQQSFPLPEPDDLLLWLDTLSKIKSGEGS